MAATGTVALNLTGNVQQQLAKINKQVKDVNTSFTGLGNTLRGLAIGTVILNTLRWADSIEDLSSATGIAIGTIQGFTNAVQLNGGNAEKAQQSLLKFVESIGAAANGSTEAQEAFFKAGVTLEELGRLSEEDLLKKTIQGLANISDEAVRAKTQATLLGKSFRGVSTGGVATDLPGSIRDAAKSEAAIIKAAAAQRKLEEALYLLRTTLVTTLQPLSELIIKINANEDAIKSAIGTIKALAIAWLAFAYIPGKITSAFEILYKVLAGKGVFGAIKKDLTSMGAAFSRIFNLVKNGVDYVSKLGAGASMFSKIMFTAATGVLRFIGAFTKIGAIGAIFVALTYAARDLVKAITGKDILGPFINGLETLGRVAKDVAYIIGYGLAKAIEFIAPPFIWFGNMLATIAGKVVDFAASVKDFIANSAVGKWFAEAAEAAKIYFGALDELQEVQVTGKRVSDGTADAARKVQEEYDKAKYSILDVTKAYKEQHDEMLKGIRREQQYATLSEKAVQLLEAQNAVYDRAENAIKSLQDAKREYQNEDTQLAKKMLGLIDSQIAAIRKRAGADAQAAMEAVAALQTVIDANEEIRLAVERRFSAQDQSNSLQDMRDELSLIGLSSEELEKQTAILAVNRDLREALLDIDRQQAELGEKITNQQLDHFEKLREAARAYSEERLRLEQERIAKTQAMEQSYAAGIKKSLEDIAQQYKPINVAQDAVRMGWDKIGSAVDEFAETGKFKFSDFARSVIVDLGKMIAKALIFKAIQTAMGAFFPGLKIPGLAGGGDAKAGKAYIVGEKGPELFVPKNSGTVIPNNQIGSAGGKSQQAPQTINYINNNISAIDSKSVAQLFYENRKALFGSMNAAQKEMPYSA
jgi:lambda family phage tail tape measure protein